MTQKDQKFQDMRTAAEESGLDIPTGKTLDELETIWSDLESALQPTRPGEYSTELRHPAEMGEGNSNQQDEQPVNHGLFIWKISASVAALIAFGFLVIQGVMLRSTIEDMQIQVKNLEFSLMQSSLQSASAAKRIDGLLKLASATQVDPLILKSIAERMTLDPNTNVRLASVKALARHADQPQVLTWLEDAILTEESPLVALEILSILWNHDMPRAESLWEQMQQDSRFESIIPVEPKQI